MKWKSKRILVTGGAGFLGSSLINKLVQKNCEITVIDDFSSGGKTHIESGVLNVISGNVKNEKVFNRITDIDYIFHLGSPSSIILFNRHPKECFVSTTIGWYNVLTFAKEQSVKKILTPSSGSVYGYAPPPHFETTLPIPGNLYALAKLTCENLTRLYVDAPPTVMLRIFGGYGPGESHKGEYASPVTLFLNKIISDTSPIVFGDGSQSRDFIYVDDITEIMLRSMESDFTGILNAGSGLAYSFNTVIEIINDRLSKKVKPVYVPKPISYLENTLANTDKLESVLNIKPLSLEEGLDKYCDILGL